MRTLLNAMPYGYMTIGPQWNFQSQISLKRSILVGHVCVVDHHNTVCYKQRLSYGHEVEELYTSIAAQ